jgi:5-methylcytosine-specific restriction endonuclease McrA
MSNFYDLAVWKKARKIQLAEQPLCELCAASGRTISASDVDHIVPISLGRPMFDPDNFRSYS